VLIRPPKSGESMVDTWAAQRDLSRRRVSMRFLHSSVASYAIVQLQHCGIFISTADGKITTNHGVISRKSQDQKTFPPP
jgi:hypothetical protein